jgi:ADP-heptose:LPS heptosyltransferase
LANTSTAELLSRCLAGESWSDELLRSSLADDDGRAFFRIVVERLGDSFEPRLCDVYARLFARVIELVHPEIPAPATVERYERIRHPRVCEREPRRVYILSRVTLGADVAVTSVLLDAAKRRFPDAEILFAGPRKNWELFAADPGIRHYAFAYPRAGSIAERLATWPVFHDPDCIVIDPDSRLTQLGLLPVCPESQYFFFESRAYGADQPEASLVKLTREWARYVFEVADARAFIAPEKGPIEADIAVSFGVGDNPEKRMADPFEEQLLRSLAQAEMRVVLDEGAGGEETERVRQLCRAVPGVQSWNGAYAPFADAISNANLYVGYDSAGQHVAAACGTPLISVFAGFTSDRMFHRWRPDGPGRINVVKVDDRTASSDVLARVLQNLTL